MDMCSGGGQKEEWAYILIEAPESEAKVIFYNRFGHNPERVTCTCCGEDYSIDEEETLAQGTAYDRGCAWVRVTGEDGGGHYEERKATERFSMNEYQTLKEYEARPDVLILREADIKAEERAGDVPDQGYVWVE
jgi:hypothetical protein